MKTYPLLQSQLGIFLAWVTAPSTTGYNLASAVPFSRRIDGQRLAAALRQVIDSHPELYTRFVLGKGGEPRQVIDMSMTIPVARKTMTEEQADHYIHHDFVRPYQPYCHEPLCRFEVIETPRHTYLLTDFHHTIADGLTIARNIMGKDIPKAYLSVDNEASSQYLPPYLYAEVEQASFDTAAYQHAKSYYQEKFRDVVFTQLSADVSDPWGKWLHASSLVPRHQVDAWCMSHQVSSHQLFLAAFCQVLSRLSRQQRVAFFAINHGRFDKRLADSYGMFVRSVPILADVCPQQTVVSFIRNLRQELMSTIRHHAYPFSHFCRDLQVVPHITFGFQSDNILEHVTLDGDETEGIQLYQGSVKNDLGCMVYVKGGAYEIRFDSSDAYHDLQRLSLLAQAVKTSVEQMMAHGDAPLSAIGLVAREEENHLLALSRGEKMTYDSNKNVLQLILEQAEKTPNRLAVDDGEGTLTYRELAQQSDAIARQLEESGIGQGDIVPITTGRRKEFLTRVLAAWRVGAAYLPCSSSEPIITQRKTAEGTAYLMRTSGSSGRPKEVMIPHSALLNLVHFIRQRWHLTENSRIACHSSLVFDGSVEDLFPVLTVGGAVFIIPEEVRKDLPLLHQYLTSHAITGGCYTTQFGVMLASQYDLHLDYLCLGGERLTVVPPTRLPIYNTYGPTECTVDATYHQLDPCRQYQEIPIGRPLPNTAAYVVDAELHLLPQGAVGELCLAGKQLALGYYQEPTLTAQRFVDCPFAAGKMYRTGDLARWNEHGELEFMGRTDRQVKLRGYRIDPEEIEKVLLQVEGITRVVVTIDQQNGHDILCASYTAERPIAPIFLRQQVGKSLPHYMIPTAWQQLTEMPLLPSGKVNIALLPRAAKPLTATYEPPANQEEQHWCDIFSRVLGMNPVGATDNFFDCGGTSLMVIQLQAEANKLGYRLSYGDVFQKPTPRELAQQRNEEHTPSLKGLGMTNGQKEQLPPFPIPSLTTPPKGQGEAPILLTGASGFLGIHILASLLEQTEKDIYCLVRKKEGVGGEERLRHVLHEYFGTGYDEITSQRVTVVEGNITDSPDEMIRPFKSPALSYVIHCAALVKHYAPGIEMEEINVRGTLQMKDLCLKTGAHLVYVSTTSIHQGHSPYLLSKRQAEKIVEKSMAEQGLQATIVRVGNLMPRSRDCHFQPNREENAFFMSLQALRQLGCYPRELSMMAVDLSPVDWVAQDLVRLCMGKKSRLLILHHPHPWTLQQLLSLLKTDKGTVEAVDKTVFEKNLRQAIQSSIHAKPLSALLMLAGERNTELADVWQEITTDATWPPLTEDYVRKIMAQYVE